MGAPDVGDLDPIAPEHGLEAQHARFLKRLSKIVQDSRPTPSRQFVRQPPGDTSMASIHKQIHIDPDPSDAWDALRDFGALHQRLAAGFAADTQLDGRDRIVTFFNGAVVRERLIDLDDDARRLAWSIIDGSYTHHNGVARVVPGDDAGTLFTWTTDLLPDELASRTNELMELGIQAVKRTLEAADRRGEAGRSTRGSPVP